jgi:hypothetical protein
VVGCWLLVAGCWLLVVLGGTKLEEEVNNKPSFYSELLELLKPIHLNWIGHLREI